MPDVQNMMSAIILIFSFVTLKFKSEIISKAKVNNELPAKLL